MGAPKRISVARCRFVGDSWALSHQVLRQLQQGLAKCYSVAFEKSGAVSDAKITPHTLNFVKKLVSTFGVGLENVSNVSTMFSSAASESLARRAQATAQDPVFQKLKGQFTSGEYPQSPSHLPGNTGIQGHSEDGYSEARPASPLVYLYHKPQVPGTP